MTQPAHTDPTAFFARHDIQDVECIFADISGYPLGKPMPADAGAAGSARTNR